MRRVILTLMASLLSCSTVSAFWPEAVASSLEIGVLYRNDEIIRKTGSSCSSGCSSSYSSSSSSSSSNDVVGEFSDSRSKIKYKNLNIWGIQAGGKYVTCDDIYLRACGDYGWITSGKIHHHDYLGLDDSSCGYDYSGRRDSNHIRGHVYDLKLGIGYLFHWCDDSFGIAPVVGYAWNGQHLKQHRHNNDSSSCDSSYSYSGYDDYSSYGYGNDRARYHTRWNGPFVGFDADYKFLCDWSIFGGYEFHWGSFHAKGRDGRENGALETLGLFNSKFHQRSERVYGHVLNVGMQYDLCECWTLGVKGEFQWWEARHGHSRIKVSESDVGCHDKTILTFKQRMKEVEWYSAGVTLDVGMVF